MAKRGASRTVIAGAGIGVLLAVILPVMFFVFGLGNSDVLPQETDPDPFEVPLPVICPENTFEMDGVCVPDLDPILEEPDAFCELSSEQLQQVAECNVLTQDEQLTNEPATTEHPCNDVSLEVAVECSEQVNALIDEIIQSLHEEDPIPENGTETSIDDPFTQLCDQDPSLIICGESRSLEILTRVLKTDSEGNQSTVETVTDLPFAFELFVEDTSNIDFSTGRLQFEVFIVGDPDFRYSGTGIIDLLIGEESIFTAPLNVQVDGVADEEGMIELLFVSPTGQTSDLLLFDFESNFDKFLNEQTTDVRLHVVELNIAGERDQDFALLNQDLFTMDIFRDDIQILITDEQGIESRVYPSDSIIIIQSKANVSEEFVAGQTRQRILESEFRGNGLGCAPHKVISDRTFTPTQTETASVPAPDLGTIMVLDSEGNVIDQGIAVSNTYNFNELTRNQNYTVTIQRAGITSGDLDYDKSQETKTYQCVQEATVNVVSRTYTSGDCSRICSTCVQNTYQQFGSLNLGAITCNIPEE